MAIGAGIRKRDQAAGRLDAIFAISWRSWGESVGVRSALPTTLIDWGKNGDNVRRFLAALTK